VIRGKNMLRGVGKRPPPAHAGRLTRWERVAFAMVFLLMLLYVLAVTISAVRSGNGASQPRGPAGVDHSPAVTRTRQSP
jgi:cytochrome oxidase Cu insertion factor (SCO1/SenC/PrrC family)